MKNPSRLIDFITRGFVCQSLALLALALGLPTQGSAQTFTPGDVFWATSLAQTSAPVSGQIRTIQITASGDYSSAPAFAVLPDRVYGQIAFTADRTTGYVPSFFLNRVLTLSSSGVVGDGSPGHPIFATGVNRPTGMLVVRTGALAGHLLCSSFGHDNIVDITGGGDFTSATAYATSTPSARNIVQLTDGTILVATSNGVRNITAGGASTSFASGFSGRDIIQTSNGTLYATTSTGTVLNITAGGNFSAAIPFASGQVFVGLAIDSTGRILASVSDGTAHTSMLFDITAGGNFSSATAFVTNLPGESETCLDMVPGDPLVVTTNGATGVTGATATLNGTLNPGNLASSGYFEYGTSPTLATFSTTPSVSIPAGGAGVSFSKFISGLTPFTPYYFRAVGTNVQYTVKGGILPFTTGSPNNAPTPQDDSLHPPAGFGAFTINVLANDTDPEMDPLTVFSVDGGTQGTPSVTAGGGSVTYTPGPGYDGNDTFTYTVSDGAGGFASATVTLHNAAPTAQNDSVHPPTGLAPFIVDVLANDSDPDLDSFTVLGVASGTVGTPSVTAGGGSVTYTPGTGYNGNDTFMYTIQDAEGATSMAIVTLTNTAPVAQDDSVHPPAGLGPFTVSVLGNDSDPDLDSVSVVSTGGGTLGTPSVTVGGGSATYAPGVGYDGNDIFTYTIDDGRGATAMATVTLHNTAPIANDDHVLLTGSAVTIHVLANDTDADAGDSVAFAVSAVTDGAHGTVTNNGPDVTYNLTSPFAGEDTFTYTMTDGRGATATATVTVQTIVNICNFSGASVPGAPAGSTFKGFGAPSVVDGGIEAYKAAIKTPAGTRNVIVAGDPAAVVVTKGDPAPGLSGVLLGTFKDPVLNDLGNVAFVSGLSGGVVSTNNSALTTNLGGALAIAARKGQEMPGGPAGNALYLFKSVAITDTAVFFTGQLAVGPGGVTSANDFGLWVWHPGTGLESIVQESGMVGGKQVKTITVLASVSGSQGQGRSTHGDLALARLTFTDNTQAIHEMSASTDSVLVAAGDTLTSGVTGAKWLKFGIPGLNGNGASAFLGTLATGPGGVSSANNLGVFTGFDAASLDLVARKGQNAPDVAGTKFASFKDPLLNADGHVAFAAGIAGGVIPSIAKKGIWTSDDLGFHLVARGGDQPVGTPAGVQWSSFVGTVLPDRLGPIFTAKLVVNVGGVDKTNSFGIWGRDGFGVLYLLTRTGDQLVVNGTPRTVRTIYALNAASGSPGQGRAYSHDGTIVYRVKFVDGTEAILCATLPTSEPPQEQ